MSILKAINQTKTLARNFRFDLNNPISMKHFINLYPPYLGAGVRVDEINYDKGYICVKMPLTRWNRNIVGTQFGGSLYSMTDPFFMALLMQKLGKDYVVWDKSASIDFIKAGTGTVYAKFMIDDTEVETIKELAKDGQAVFREYELNITNDKEEVIAHVKKTVYIRLRTHSKSKGFVSRV